MSTHISSIVFTNWLPEESKMPQTDLVSTKAGDLETHAESLNNAYKDTQAIWVGIDSHITFDSEQEVINGFSTNCEALGSAAHEGLMSIAKALKTFAEDIGTFRTGTYDPLKKDVDAFNALPTMEYTEAEKTTRAEAGNPVGTTRTAAARTALINRLNPARTTYEAHVKTCVDAIKDCSPASVPIDKPVAMTVIKNVQKSYNLATTWVGRAGDLKSFKGKMGFLWEAKAPTLSKFVSEGVPGWMKVHDPKSWLGKWLPESFKNKIPRFDDLSTYAFWKNADKRYANFLNGMEGLGRHYWLGTLANLPPGVTKWISQQKGRVGDYVRLNSKIDKKTGNVKMKWTLNPDRKMTAGERQWLKKFDGWDKKLEKFQKGPGGKFIDKAGKVLGVVDTALTFHNTYTESYNEALRENPGASEAELRKEAGISTAYEAGGETVGKVVGGVVGRTAGAAVGQALIPIPGVGAAVGGFVGGIIGESVGGTVGKAVGGFLNDVRKDGWGSAVASAGESAGKVVENTGKAIGDAAKAVGGSVKKLFGWG